MKFKKVLGAPGGIDRWYKPANQVCRSLRDASNHRVELLIRGVRSARRANGLLLHPAQP